MLLICFIFWFTNQVLQTVRSKCWTIFFLLPCQCHLCILLNQTYTNEHIETASQLYCCRKWIEWERQIFNLFEQKCSKLQTQYLIIWTYFCTKNTEIEWNLNYFVSFFSNKNITMISFHKNPNEQLMSLIAQNINNDQSFYFIS